MKFEGFVGPSYKLDSVNVDCQRSVNLYPEIVESGNGKDGATVYLKSTPGLTQEVIVGDGPIRLIHRLETPSLDKDPLFPQICYLIISGNKVFLASFDSEWTVDQVPGWPSTLGTSSGIVKAKSNLQVAQIIPPTIPPLEEDPIDVYTSVTIFADGDVLYSYTLSPSSTGRLGRYQPQTNRPSEEGGEVLSSSHVVMIDGYFICNEMNSSRFYVSDWNSPVFDPLSFASSEGDPDLLVALGTKNRELWLFNERTTEVFYNSGNADFPFERAPGGFIEKGCLAPHSVDRSGDVLLWLGRDFHGQGVVYAAKGISEQRVSTFAVESAIKKYKNPEKATAYTYSDQGHSFYVLNFEEATWVYDLSTGLWHERAYTDESSSLERHRADLVSFMSEHDKHLCGDYQNGKIYCLDFNSKTDDGAPITRMRVFPHASSSLKRVFFKSLKIDMETGVGLDGNGQGSDPQAMLDWSNDGGHTWSNELWSSLGRKIGGIGDFKKRVVWNRLGYARDRVFRLKITDPVSVTLMSAEIDLSVGAS